MTLRNLEVLETPGGDAKGSLLGHLDRCATPFGRRALREWVLAPLRDARDVRARADAVDELCRGRTPEADALRAALRPLRGRDLERLLQQVHTLGAPNRSAVDGAHPDASAQM